MLKYFIEHEGVKLNHMHIARLEEVDLVDDRGEAEYGIVFTDLHNQNELWVYPDELERNHAFENI